MNEIHEERACARKRRMAMANKDHLKSREG